MYTCIHYTIHYTLYVIHTAEVGVNICNVDTSILDYYVATFSHNATTATSLVKGVDKKKTSFLFSGIISGLGLNYWNDYFF